ncbi:glycosyltransferase [Roseibium sp.]|uniref:glycosyltransferase n=1 Tax=Roseibium sp. TaxID=1936156 RepID=UPI0039EF5D64
MAHFLYLLVCIQLALLVPISVVDAASGAIVVLGFIGIWRYSWAGVNILRAAYFLKIAHPRRRQKAEIAYALQPQKAHAFFLTTTYKIAPEISARVYRSVFAAAANSQGGATVVASVVDASDMRLIRHVFSSMPVNMSNVKLVFDRIAGTGKRDALAVSLRTIAKHCPTRRDIVIFVDGDSCVPEDVVERSAAYFVDDAIGALTTDETSEATGGQLFKDWFDLRFSQRQMMMCSMGLGERVLTLTGRMSVFRADLATHPEFVAAVQTDYIDHWRLGRVNFLTGDDKSTWFWLLKNGYKMAYLPDVRTISIETQPRESFVSSAIVLMTRWFGNMLRTNGRALALSPSRIGLFTWWSILDQRVSMWTTLVGPVSLLLASVYVDPLVLLLYFSWVMFTRYIYCAIISLFRGRYFPITYPFLLYFGQIVGALVKSFILFRLDRQKWTRQNTTTVGSKNANRLLPSGTLSFYLHSLAVYWLVFGVAWIAGIS